MFVEGAIDQAGCSPGFWIDGADMERQGKIRTSKYLYEDTSSSGVPLRMRVEREEEKEGDLRVMIM